MVTRILLYLMGGLAGAIFGAGMALYLVKSVGLAAPLAGAFTGLIIAVFLGVAHMLARQMVVDDEDSHAPALPREAVNVPRALPCSAWLIPTGGSGNRVTYPLTKACTLIGRDVENDVMINSGSMSRSHAQIVQMDGTWLVLDLDSKNGTFVNGERVSQKQLRDGDELVLGSVHFRLRIEDFSSHAREEAGRDDPRRESRDPRDSRDPSLPPGAETYTYRAGNEEGWATSSGRRSQGEWAASGGNWSYPSGPAWPPEDERRRPYSPYDPPYPEEDRRRGQGDDRRGMEDRRRHPYDGPYPGDRRQNEYQYRDDRRTRPDEDFRRSGGDRRSSPFDETYPDDRRQRDRRSDADRRRAFDETFPDDRRRNPRDFYPPPPPPDDEPPPPPRW
jgi:hypothetical protein